MLGNLDERKDHAVNPVLDCPIGPQAHGQPAPVLGWYLVLQRREIFQDIERILLDAIVGQFVREVGDRSADVGVRNAEQLLDSRSHLDRWILGKDIGLDVVEAKQSGRLLAGRNRLQFSMDALAEAGVEFEALKPFLFDLADRSNLLSVTPNGSPLEHRPLVFDGKNVHVVLPTAVGAAIRSFVVSALQTNANGEAVKRAIVNVYGWRVSHRSLMHFLPCRVGQYSGPRGSQDQSETGHYFRTGSIFRVRGPRLPSP